MTMNEMRSLMSKCKYYTEDARNEPGGILKIYGRCYGMKYAPNVSCCGDETKCEICKTGDEMQSNTNYELVNETVFQIKITGKDGTNEKVYCKTISDAISYIQTFLCKRDISRVYSLQVSPIKNLYYKKK